MGDPDIDARITEDARLVFNKSLLLDKHYWELVKQIKVIQDFGKKKPIFDDEQKELFELKKFSSREPMDGLSQKLLLI